MKLAKWEPFSEAEEFFRQFGSSMTGRWPRLAGNGGVMKEWTPVADISETDKEYVVKAEVPGVKPGDIKVTLDKGVLAIEGERKYESEDKNEKSHRVERFYGSFSRSFTLPEDANAEAIQKIRAAITLKLSSFEETGGIVAALTTSLPESPHSGRNWDYRYCWPRDAYFVVKALNRIGATRTMEGYIEFILSIAGGDDALKPCYGIVPNADLKEWIAPELKGFQNHGPVRFGNAAVDQVQHDAYGSVILSAVPMFFDRRLPSPGGEALFGLIEKLAGKCAELALKPDAGIWEYRGRARIHTHSAAMCWAGLSRAGAIANRLGLVDRATHWNGIADTVRGVILERCWNEKRQAFAAGVDTDDMDASVLLLPELGLIDAHDPRFISTVAAIEKELVHGRHVLRYAAPDDFGLPEAEFLVCRFWLIDALCLQGRAGEARERFNDALSLRNQYGLFAEDIHRDTGQLWGNFPQTYSMAGLILSAMRLSRSWEERYWHASS